MLHALQDFLEDQPLAEGTSLLKIYLSIILQIHIYLAINLSIIINIPIIIMDSMQGKNVYNKGEGLRHALIIPE